MSQQQSVEFRSMRTEASVHNPHFLWVLCVPQWRKRPRMASMSLAPVLNPHRFQFRSVQHGQGHSVATVVSLRSPRHLEQGTNGVDCHCCNCLWMEVFRHGTAVINICCMAKDTFFVVRIWPVSPTGTARDTPHKCILLIRWRWVLLSAAAHSVKYMSLVHDIIDDKSPNLSISGFYSTFHSPTYSDRTPIGVRVFRVFRLDSYQIQIGMGEAVSQSYESDRNPIDSYGNGSDPPQVLNSDLFPTWVRVFS